jgi:hypothetical protein
MLRATALLLLLFVSQGRPVTGKVNSTYDKSADFKALKTYSWVAGQKAYNPAVHSAIVAAVDGEMASLGLKKVDGTGDVTVRYLAVRSTSVDLDKLQELEKQKMDASGADVTVGRLVIAVEDGKSAKRLWAADSVERLNPSAKDNDAVIKSVVARMFETYPTRLKQ